MNFLIPIFSSLSLIIIILLFIVNPGIIYSDSEIINYNEKIYCEECKFLYPNTNIKMQHCFKCGVCVCNYDHHCGVTGKCVGKYNTKLFIMFIFILSAFMSCLYLLLFNFIFNRKISKKNI